MSSIDIVKPTTATAMTTTTTPTTTSSQNENNTVNTNNNVGTPFARTKSQQAITPLALNNNNSNNNNNDKVENVQASARSKILPKPPDEFYKDLQLFHERRGTPIMHIPKISGREINLHQLYSEVTERGGFLKVNHRDEWDEVLLELGLRDKCVNATAALKMIYRRCLEKYERLYFFGEDPDKMEALEASEAMDIGGRSRARYPSILGHQSNSGVNTVPMSYNYRQHIVNMDRRRMYKLSTDLYKASPYEKLMLSLISPLPNEQDFAINICTLMANENKHNTLKLYEYPKLLDVLLAHAGVFVDHTLRRLFHQVYTDIRKHSLYGFWRDLLQDKPQIMELYAKCDEQLQRPAEHVHDLNENITEVGTETPSIAHEEPLGTDILNLSSVTDMQDWVGLRVQQIVGILRNLSFIEDNQKVFAKNRTFLRFIVMSANIRWSNIHIQALDIAGNVASDLELLDPTLDELSRSLMATLCDGIEGLDRAVIINSLEILYKLCQKDSNEEYIHKCLNLKFYQTICLFLSLNDIMLLIFTLEAIYALTSLGARSCHLFMQVRGLIDQLVSLISVEAQSYGPDGCILMRVVETVPGNMLPMVAQNIANLQNVAVIQKQHQHQQQQQQFSQNVPAVPVTPTPTATVQVPPAAQHTPMNSVDQNGIPSTESLQPVQQQQSTSQQGSNASPQAQGQNFTQEDDQYALAWLGATFERAPTVDSHIDQQELYRMYLSHCQKAGKHSVVNHMQFPKLVRILFGNTVGPVVVRRRSDGSELPGLHYVTIRLRAQALPIQVKGTPHLPQPKLIEQKIIKVEPNVLRKLKKKPKSDQPQTSSDSDSASGTPTKMEIDASGSNQPSGEVSSKVNTSCENSRSEPGGTSATVSVIQMPKQPDDKVLEARLVAKCDENPKTIVVTKSAQPSPSPTPPPAAASSTSGMTTLVVGQTSNPTEPPTTIVQASIQSAPNQHQHQPTSSLIKSLLANKVTQRQLKQKELTAAPVVQTITQTNVMASSGSGGNGGASSGTVIQQQSSHQPIKVTSTAISALVNNPLMQNTPVKVGQTTIKPLNSQTIEKKQMMESTPPPLAPLSGSNVTKDVCGRPVIIANQMLVEILDKKGAEPPIPATIIKRKIDDSGMGESGAKRIAVEVYESVKDEVLVTPSKNAANLYAEMAASILEDEDLDDIPPMTTPSTIESSQQSQQSIIIPAKIQQAPMQNVQRQLLFQSNATSQLKLTQPSGAQIPTAMATIKTDQGLQTVPVILQQKTMEQSPSAQIIQQVIQQQATPQSGQQTQYVLATNQQGQTYLVAQQSHTPPPPPPPTQTVLVTQSPQQTSGGTKTIIILQQQTMHPQQGQQSHQLIGTANCGGSQKMIMTTPQGQQVLVTQRPQSTLSSQAPQQIFINSQTGATTHIQQVVGGSIVTQQTGGNLLQRQIIPSSALVSSQQHHQQASGQISPSLLSQLNHIPATIKLHQPQVSQALATHHQGTTITSRLGKSVSIVQQTPSLPPPPPPPPIQIPQLQQHQSIIQQHIVSGPSTEKRQVLLGGRAVEIKETTVTTQTSPSTTPLTSHSIIGGKPSQQVQAIQQQLPLTPIIQQQKITMPVQQAHSQTIVMAAPKQQQHQQQHHHQHQQQQHQQLGKGIAHSVSVVQATVTPTATHSTQASMQSVKKIIATPIKPQPAIEKFTTGGNGQLNQVTAAAAASTSVAQAAPTTTLVSSVAHPKLAAQQEATPKVTAKAVEVKAQVQVSATNTGVSTTNVPSTVTTTPQSQTQTQTSTVQPSQSQSQTPQPAVLAPQAPLLDPNWLYVCDWRNCPRRKFKSLGALQHHACSVHCPDHLDPAADIFCQWGVGPGLCDGIPRKRYSLMTHLIDRHISTEGLRAAAQRRIATGTVNIQPVQPPVTIVRHNVEQSQRNSTASPAPSNASSNSSIAGTGSSAIHAIKRHTADFVNAKELMDENEGPVTKSIRLTASLILRNLVTYTPTAKRSLRRYEPHLANIALSNVESSSAISHILYEMNN